jgi:hypothetical protein
MDFRQRLEQSRVQMVTSDASDEQEDQSACPYFAADRSKSPICLELRLPDGGRKAIPYAYFTEINFDADEGIEILTTQKRINITGRRLSRLFDYLVTYRVRYVQADVGNDIQEDGLFVEGILIEEL